MAVKKSAQEQRPKNIIIGMANPARLWKRVLAFLFDIIIIDFVLFYPFKGIIERSMPGFEEASFSSLFQTVQPSPALITASLSMTFIALLYFSLMEYKTGQTLGKMLFSLRAVSLVPEKPLSYWQCLLRALFIIPVFPFVLLWIFDPVYAFFNSGRQRLLEMISKTATIENYLITQKISKT